MSESLRQQLLSLLEKQHLLSVAEMLDWLKKTGKSYNKTSVYRALEQLLSENILCRHYFDEAEALYELREHHHAHLFCRHCGKVFAAESSYYPPKEVKGFRVDHYHLTLIGLCPNCQKAL